MTRGTSPKIHFIVPVTEDLIKELYVTFSQLGKELFTISKSECTFKGNDVSVNLTQEQTLMFKAGIDGQMQIRLHLIQDDYVIASCINEFPVLDVLKDCVI